MRTDKKLAFFSLLFLGLSLAAFSQEKAMKPYFSGGISPIAPFSEGWDFSASRHARKFSLTLIFRGGFRSEGGGILDQMFETYETVRLDINRTLAFNPRYHFVHKKGVNYGLYTGGLLAYETWTIQSRATTTLGQEEAKGNPYAGFNVGYIWYPSLKRKENPRFFIDVYMHFIWKLDETERQVVGDQNYQIRTFAITRLPTIHLGYRF